MNDNQKISSKLIAQRGTHRTFEQQQALANNLSIYQVQSNTTMLQNKIALKHSFILHSRAYQETSLILDLFSKEQGLCSVIAKGGRRQKSPFQGLLQPFTPLLLQWVGKSSLKTLQHAELISQRLPLLGRYLFAGFYLNELLMRTLKQGQVDVDLFYFYLQALQSLAIQSSQCSQIVITQVCFDKKKPEMDTDLNIDPLSIEPILRKFELKLIQQLGYGIDLLHCAATGEPIVDDLYYYYKSEQGMIATMQPSRLHFLGHELRAIATGTYTTIDQVRAAKRFFRLVLKPYIGDKPLKSRELFASPVSVTAIERND